MNISRLICCVAALGLGSVAAADPFYSATTPRTFPGDALSYYYNPGPDNGGESGHILFDDVTVQTPWTSPLFNVKKVTVKVTQKAGAPATTVTPYFSQLFSDPVPNTPPRGGSGDGPDVDPRSPSQFAQAAVIAGNSTGQSIENAVSWGNGTSTLFNVTGIQTDTSSQFRSFAVGLNFSTTDSLSGWTLAQLPENLDLLWDYKNDSSYAEFTYSFDDGGTDIRGVQYLVVEGLVLSGVPGDATIDGRVDINDLARLAAHWNQPGDYTQGDFDFNGVVNAADLGILAAHWQNGVSSLLASEASVGLPESAVPEPSIGMLMLGMIGLGVRVRGRAR